VGALAPNALLVVCVSAFSTALVWRLTGQVNQDAWLALASGREIVQHGLPHTDSLTLWGGGKTWVDQQWLSQLAFFGVEALGGLALLAFLHALLSTAAYGGAVAVARAAGASARSVLFVLPPALWLLIGSTWQVRTQSFAYPLFVVLLWLLASDSRRPSRRVLCALPLLVLWANLHGSVAIGVALCVLRGGVELVRRRRSPALALLAAPLALLATPYGLGMLGYYRDTLFNTAFSTMLNEWEPLSFGLGTLPFFALAGFVVWVLGRARGTLTGFEQAALLATGASALSATRNTVWFALTVIALAPLALDRAFPARGTRPASRRDVVLAAAALTVLAVAGMSTLLRSDAWFARDFPPAAASRAVAAAHGGPVFADVKYADWLVWKQPKLRGRIAFDARFELLPLRRIYEIYNFDNPYGRAWASPTRGFQVLVLDSRLNAVPIRQILAEGRMRVVSRDAAVTVLTR
jgi:hypothetical protein